MAKITRQTMLWFGSNAGGSDIGVFGSLANGSPTYSQVISTIQSLPNWGTGWAGETIATNRPALEDMNAYCYVTSYGMCYLYEMGIPEYDAGTVYYTNSICQYSGVLYTSLVDNNVSVVPTSSTVNWTPTMASQMPSGSIVQLINTIVGTYATGTTSIPQENTIPQNNEGDQYMSLAIIPKSALNKLKIDIVFFCSLSSGTGGTVALFQDTNNNALAAVGIQSIGAGGMSTTTFTFYMVAGTTSSTTFKVRAGCSGGQNTYFSGIGNGDIIDGDV